jgi:hypothetical protein
MAKKTSIINVVVAGDSKPFRRSLDKANDSMANFGRALGRMSVAAGVAIAGLAVKSLDLAVDFEEGLSKAQQIFGEVSNTIIASADGAATAVGMSKSEYLEAASTFGVFGKAAGLSGTVLGEFADEFVTLAADVASFNNIKPEEAVEKLAAGLRGSFEPLQSVGVLMTAAAVEAHAVEMGIIDLGDELTENQKIIARSSLIFQQLGEQGAMGDFARTSDGLANKQRILNARMKNLGITMGMALIPVAERLAAGLEVVLGKFEEWAPAIQDAIGWADDFITKGVLMGKSLVFSVANDINEFVDKIWPKVDAAFDGTVNFIKNDLIPELENLGRELKNWFEEDAWPAIENFYNEHVFPLMDKIGEYLHEEWGVGAEEEFIAPGPDFFTPELAPPGSYIPPHMRESEIYPQQPPVSMARGGGTTINVNMPAGSDGQDVVAALQRYVRQNGAADIATSNLVRI